MRPHRRQPRGPLGGLDAHGAIRSMLEQFQSRFHCTGWNSRYSVMNLKTARVSRRNLPMLEAPYPASCALQRVTKELRSKRRC
jgi:hypothetical protein